MNAVHAIACSILAIVAMSAAQAADETGTIQTLHVNLATNRAHVQFVGVPQFSGGACSGPWTGNSLDDEKFMKVIWPLLVAAKAAGTPITLSTAGCLSDYPVIVAIDSEPRVVS